MAFLRRGLVTNRGAIPSVHNKRTSYNNDAFEPNEPDPQPNFEIRQVKRVIKMGATSKDLNVVELVCGHTTYSRSIYQACCKACCKVPVAA